MFNEAAYKGKQMIPGNTKTRVTALQDGYFAKEYPRIFEKEAYTDAISNRRKDRMNEARKNIAKQPFITFKGETKGLNFILMFN